MQASEIQKAKGLLEEFKIDLNQQNGRYSINLPLCSAAAEGYPELIEVCTKNDFWINVKCLEYKLRLFLE